MKSDPQVERASLYRRYLAMDRMQQAAERAGMVVASIALNPENAAHSTSIEMQVRDAEEFFDADTQEAAMKRLAARWWPDLKLHYPGGTLIYLEGTLGETKVRFYTAGRHHDKGSEND